ncbi:MAG: oligopeptidase B, partial [Eudoraea sp.]|nr:oligopeptidase B [Eudoraea sp.]
MRPILKIIPILALSSILAASCQNNKGKEMPSTPPKAKKIEKELSIHGDTRIDPYYWLNKREDPEVIAYLEQENVYYQAATAHTKDFQQDLFEEMKSRIKEDDSSVPYKLNEYWYATRYEKGKEYPLYTRRAGSLDAEEEIMFDCNALAADHEYFNLRGISVSPDNTFAAFGTDTISRRQYHIQVKNLKTGEVYADKIDNTTGGSVWASDNKTLFYVRKDPETLRSEKIYKHVLGTPTEQDELVYHEKDETFNVYVYKSKSRDYIVIGSNSTMTSEYHILKADNPN